MAFKLPEGVSSQERTAHIISMYQSGKTLRECGEEYGLTRARVQQILKAVGVERRTTGQALTSKQAPDLRDLLRCVEAGMSCTETSEELGCPKRVARQTAKRYDLQFTKRSSRQFRCTDPYEPTNQRISTLISQGYSVPKISEIIRMSQHSIYLRMALSGIRAAFKTGPKRRTRKGMIAI